MILQRSEVLSFLQVQPAESRRVRSLTLLMTLTCAGGAIASPGVEALFYARFGVEFLPYMYVALGLVTALTSLVITGLLGRIAKHTLYQWFPLVLASVVFTARLLLVADRPWLYPTLWLLTYLIWTLQFFMIWGLAGSVFDTRQAKRLFPLFAAGGILGTAAGGLMTRPLVGVVGAENLLLAWSIAFAIGFFLVSGLRSAVRQVGRRRGPPSLKRDLQRGYRLVIRSPLLRWMSWSAMLLGLLLFSVMFPFSKAVAEAFPNEDQLAGFLGVFGGLSTAVAFLTSLLLTNRLFARLGFMGGLVGFPLIYLIGFSALAIWPAFAAVAALRFMQLLWRLGVADTAFQAVFNVLPAGQREPARAFVDGVPRQGGVMLAGILLLLSERTLQPVHTYLFGLAVSAICLLVLWRARGAYRTALAEALREGRPQVFFSEDEPFGGFRNDAAAVATAVRGISDPDPVVRRVAAEILGRLRLPEASRALVGALDDPDPSVRASLLRSLARTGETAALLEVAARLRDPEPEVRLQAVEALRDLAGYPAGLRSQLEGLLADPSPQVRSCTAVAILQTGEEHAEAKQVLLAMREAIDPQTREAALEALSKWRDPMSLELAALGLQDSHRAVRRAAVGAIAGSEMPEAIALLVEALADEDRGVRESAAHGLATYGPAAVEQTVAVLQDSSRAAGALLALRHLPIGQSEPQLRRYAREQRERAVQYLHLEEGLGGLPNHDERVELLRSSVHASASQHAKLAIEAIGILEDLNAALLALENLTSEEREQRANALEIVEGLGGRGFSAPLLRIWDLSAPGSSATIEAPLRALEHTLADADAWIRACGALVAAGHPELESRLQQLGMSDPDPLVRQAAFAALNGDPNMQSLPTLSIMERILFLRRVPLFSELPPAELKQIAGIANEVVFESEQVIAEQGETGDEMYIIVDGEVVVLAQEDDGEPEVLAVRGPGEYVGEMAIISHEPRIASLRAAGDVRMLCIGQKEFEGILRERPETSLAVMRELIERLKEAQHGEAS